MDIKMVLSEYFCNAHKIDLDKEYTIEKIEASSLIVSNRIDLIAKFKYIEFREKGYDMTFVKQLYQKHIEAFSFGTYREPGNCDKTSIKEYFDVFDALIDEIKNKGIDETLSVIPVGSNNVILDGAHRTAIAAYYNLEVPIIRFNDLSVDYSAKFFRERALDEIYLDYLITEYCKLKSNVYFACVWPKAQGQAKLQEMKNLISNSCVVVYDKKVKLSYEGLRNLIIQVYSAQTWAGDIKDHFSGAQSKAEACYDKSGRVLCYILECDHFDQILKLKTKIRDIFKIGNQSIHITDSQPETLNIVNLLLNQNSVDYLNKGKSDYYRASNRMSLFLLKIKSFVQRKNRNLKHYSQKYLIKLLKKLRMYKSVKNFYKRLRDEK
jgi:hypothetical protein